jgi:hypothetical protein
MAMATTTKKKTKGDALLGAATTAASRGQRVSKKKPKKKLGKRAIPRFHDRWSYLRNDVARVVLLNAPQISGGDAYRIGQMICQEAEIQSKEKPKKTGRRVGRKLFGLPTHGLVLEILCEAFPSFLEAYGATDPMFKITPDQVALAAWTKWMGLMKTPRIEKLKKKKNELEHQRRLRIVEGEGDPMFEVLYLAESIMIGGARAARTLTGGQEVATSAKSAYQLAMVCRSIILAAAPQAGLDYPKPASHETTASAADTAARQHMAEETFDFARETFCDVLKHERSVRTFMTLAPSSREVRADLRSLWQRWAELIGERVRERHRTRASSVVQKVRGLAKKKAKKRSATARA